MTDQADLLEQLSRQVASLSSRLGEYERDALRARVSPASPGRAGALEGMLVGGAGVGPYSEQAIIAANAITAEHIAANAITASEIAAGAITADKLAVGARQSENLVLNPSFEEHSGGLPRGWPTATVVGTGVNVIETSFPYDGSAEMTQYAGDASSNAFIRSTAFPVSAGEKLFASIFAKKAGAATDGAYFRLAFFTATLVGVSNIDILNDANLTGTWTKYSGYITVPATAAWATVDLYNFKPNAAQYVNWDAVVVQRQAGGVRNSDGNVVIDENGVTITNGKLVVSNPSSTVIIDGTSNMFKIVASGTLTGSFPGTAGDRTLTSVTVFGTTSASQPNMCLTGVSFGTSGSVNRQNGSLAEYAADGSGVIFAVTSFWSVSGTSDCILTVAAIAGMTSQSGQSAFMKYFIFKEVSI